MNATTSRSGFALQVLKDTAAQWMANNALRLSAALAYYSIFSIAPLLIIAIGLAGWFFGADAVSGHLYHELRSMLGEQASTAVQNMVKSASRPADSMMATIIGFATLFLGASGVFGQLKDSLNTIWGVRTRSGLGVWNFVRERFLSFGMVLVIGFLLLTSLLLSTFVGGFSHWLEIYFKIPGWFWGFVSFLISFGVVTLLFALIFKVLPDAKVDWAHVWYGAVATAFLFEVGKFFLGMYLGRESTASSYGAAGSVVLLLLWIYYASCILLFGAVFTKVFAEATGHRIRPSKIAEPMPGEARAKEGLDPLPAPPRESLHIAFSDSTPLPREGLLPYLRENGAIGMAAAVGCGAVAAICARELGHKVAESPTKQLKRGSQTVRLALLILASRYAHKGWKRAQQFAKNDKVQATMDFVRKMRS